MAFRSDMDAVILSVLEEGPMHGYAIVKELKRETGGLIRMGEGQLYPALHKLEQGGMVTSQWSLQEGKPSRKLYELTSVGKDELATRRQSWTMFRSSIDSVLKI